MRVLFDISHPADVHFYRHMIGELSSAGYATSVVARDKEVTLQLLDQYEIPHLSVGRAGPKGLVRQGIELAARDLALLKETRRFGPDFILTRNPAGTQAARLARVKSIFDTDHGRPAKLHFWAAYPFAHVITSPTSLQESYGRRHREYPGYKALSFLHPDRFEPDPGVLDELGMQPGERFSIVRLVELASSHDRGERGLPTAVQEKLVSRLSEHGKVFISSEGPIAPQLSGFALPTAPHRFLDALAFASVCASDSASVPLEAGLLGTPSVFCSSWAGRMSTLNHLERQYGLVRNFPLTRVEDFVQEAERLAGDPGARARWSERREKMLSECVDITTWYLDLLKDLNR